MIVLKQYSFEDFFNLPNLAETIRDYANSSHNPLVFNVDLDYVNVIKTAYKEIMKNENVTFHALTDNGQCKGVLALIQSSNGNSPKTIIDINAIYVDPLYRRKGYGKKMFTYIDEFAKSVGASGIYFQVPVNSKLEKVLDKTSYFTKTYSLFFREV